MVIRNDIANVLGELAHRSGIKRGELSKRFHRSSDVVPRPDRKTLTGLTTIPGTSTMDRMETSVNTSETSSPTSNGVRKQNPNCRETFATLRLFGDGLVPEEVTRLLKVTPTDAALKGETKVISGGKTRTAPTGRWALETAQLIHSTNLEDHLCWLLEQVDASGISLPSLPGVSRSDVFCYWESATGHSGPEFSPEILGRLAKHGLTLGLDFYFHPDS